MDLNEQIILESRKEGCGYRKLQEKYGICLQQFFWSTYIRMNYLSKLITGLIKQNGQLFLGRDIF